MRSSANILAAVATALLCAYSADAYSVVEPTNSTGWTVGGPNTFSWTRVSTDPANFTLVLDNQSVFPQYQQILDALVDGTQNPASITVNPPSGGFVAGTGYRVNVVSDANHLDQILVQSDQFTIKAGGSSSSSGLSSGSSTGSVSGSTLSVPAQSQTSSPAPTSTSPSGTGSISPSGSDTSLSPSTSNAASPLTSAGGALFGVVAFLGALLA